MATAYGFFMLIIMAKLIYPIRKSRSRGVKKCLNFFHSDPCFHGNKQDGCHNGKI